MKNIVGISAYFHDSACCLLQDGQLVAAAQEERFSRRKHDHALPRCAFEYCLRQGGLTISDIDCVAYYEDPALKLERQISQAWPNINPTLGMALWRKAMRPREDIADLFGYTGEVFWARHHQSHAASSFYFSGFEEAAILTTDGVGEWATSTYGRACGREIEIFEEVRFPHSLGLLYSALTSYIGFAVNDGEYKVMGLAPHGSPGLEKRVRKLIQSLDDGQLRLNLDYFDFAREDRMYSPAMTDLFGRSPRDPREPIGSFECDLAFATQTVLEEILLANVDYLYSRAPLDSLCMAGGVALNCVANGRIAREGPFRRLFVQPAAGDAGGSIGAAALAYLCHGSGVAVRPELAHVFLGPAYTSREIAALLCSAAIPAVDYTRRESDLLIDTADRLAQGKVVAWFQGRMEFGPRALGARSILADPRSPDMQERLNLIVKKRESFRPFAPAVLESRASIHFDLPHPSPFMLETCRVISPLSLPAITHLNGSARVQTVNPQTSPRFAGLLRAFESRTGCPILLNTSFNVANEPIVCSPADALLSFARTEIDTLVLDDFLIDRSALSRTLVDASRVQELPATTITDRVYTLS